MRRLVSLILLSCFCVAGASAQSEDDWPTFGHDPQRSGWAKGERSLSPESVSRLELKWKTNVKNKGRLLFSLTAPIAAVNVPTANGVTDVVYTAGTEGGVFAIDSKRGEILWEWKPRTYVNPSELGLQGSLYCPNTVNATPTFDRRTNILYTIAIDGALYGLDMGAARFASGPSSSLRPTRKAGASTSSETPSTLRSRKAAAARYRASIRWTSATVISP